MVQRPMALDNDGGGDSCRRNNPLMHLKSRPRKISSATCAIEFIKDFNFMCMWQSKVIAVMLMDPSNI